MVVFFIKGKKIVSYALATVMTLQGGGLVFAGDNNVSNLQLNTSSKYNYYSEVLAFMLKNDYLKIDSDNELLVTQKYVNYVQNKLKSKNSEAFAFSYKNSIVIHNFSYENEGETKFVWTWKGFDIYLDHRICNSIVKAEDATVAISGIITLIVPEAAPIAGIIDAMLEIGKFVFESQDLGRGIIMAFIEPCILHWISSQ